MADFGSIPPEVNSARMYAGPGTDSLLTAAATWDRLAADLYEAARSHHSAATELTNRSWLGPAATNMMTATTPYQAWMHDTADMAARTAQHARAAVAAYDAARSMVIPPAVVAANRAQLSILATANSLGLHTHAIATVEAQYRDMWAQDSTAMYTYADASAKAANVTPFLPPPGMSGDVTRDRSTPSTVVQALRRLASPAKIATSMSPIGQAQLDALARAQPTGSPVPGMAPALVAAARTVGCASLNARVGDCSKIGTLSAPATWLPATSTSAAAPAAGAWRVAPIEAAAPPAPMMPTTRRPQHGVIGWTPPRRGLRTVVSMRSSD